MVDPLTQPDWNVMGRILEALWRNQGPLRPTQLQVASSTNYTQFERYLEFMAGHGLLSTRDDAEGGTWVELTVKGYEVHRLLVVRMRELLSGGTGRP
jgi:predicted transcriptional regulator